MKMWCFKVNRRQQPSHSVLLFLIVVAGYLTIAALVVFAQDDEGDMRVSERDEEGKAIRFDFNFISKDLRDLIRFLSQETDLTFVASENEIKDKKICVDEPQECHYGRDVRGGQNRLVDLQSDNNS